MQKGDVATQDLWNAKNQGFEASNKGTTTMMRSVDQALLPHPYKPQAAFMWGTMSGFTMDPKCPQTRKSDPRKFYFGPVVTFLSFAPRWFEAKDTCNLLTRSKASIPTNLKPPTKH